MARTGIPLSLLVTLAGLGMVEVLSRTPFSIPDPAPVYLAIAAYAAFQSGLWAGLTSAGLTLIYAAVRMPTMTQISLSGSEWLQWGWLAGASLAIAVMMGTLKRQLSPPLHAAIAPINLFADPFSRLLDVKIVGYFFWNVDGTILDANDTFLQIVGHSRQDLEAGQLNWRAMTPPEQLTLSDRAIARLQETRISTPLSKEYIRKTGERVPVLLGGAILEDNPALGISFMIDMTEHKRIEQELVQSEERFRQLAENIQAVFWIMDRSDHQIIYVSPAYEQIWGRPRAELYANPFARLEAIHPDDREGVERIFTTQVTQDGFNSPFQAEYRVLHTDGSVRWVRDRGFPVYDSSGKTYRVAGIAEDITERKREKAVLQANEALYRTLSEAMPQLVCSLQPDGSVDYANPRWYDYTGLTLSQAGLGATLHPSDRVEFVHRWLLCIQSGETNQIEARLKGADGTYRWFLHRFVALKDDQGRIIRWVGTSTDIHDRKQMEQERDRLLELEKIAREEAESANRIKEDFLAVLSHELRSPLNPILGWSRLLRSRALDAQTTERALETIERNAKLQAQLIEDLLDVSRILRGKLILNFVPVNLVPTIEAAMETMRLAAEAKAIAVRFEHDDSFNGAVKVMGDPNRLQQIVWNLLSNAIKFTPAEGQITIQLERQQGDGERAVDSSLPYAQLTVCDTGKGISPEFLPYVFESFRQADSSTTRQFGGLGLGLAIVRHLVELHGGTVSVASPGEGQGATFTIQLPLYIEEHDQDLL
jgi:PAS domain S-box-containing protein